MFTRFTRSPFTTKSSDFMLPDKSSAHTMSMPLALTSVCFSPSAAAPAPRSASPAPASARLPKLLPRANAAHSSSLQPVSPTNTKTPATRRAGLSTTPPAAAAGAAAEIWMGKSHLFDLRFAICTGFLANGFNAVSPDSQAGRLCTICRLRFLHQFHRRAVQLAQFRFARLVFGEFYEVAAFQKSAEAFFLFARQ